MQGRALLVVSIMAAAVLSAACAPPPEPTVPPGPGPLSLGAGDVFGDDVTTGAALSNDGAVVAFSSKATNLVPTDTNGSTDTFVRNRANGEVRRIAEATVESPHVSGNGRFVSFVALGGSYGVFDRNSGTAVSWNAPTGLTAPVVPDDGSVAIYGRTGSFGAFSTACRVRDLHTATEVDCPHGGPGYGTVALDAVSRNGRFVLYYWLDQNGGGTSGRLIWDRRSDTIEAAPSGLIVFGNSVRISDDGRYVAATDFTPGSPFQPLVFDRQAGTVRMLPQPPTSGGVLPVDISADGTVVALYSEEDLVAADTNGSVDVYLWNTSTDEVTLASRRLDNGDPLPDGAAPCGVGPGQLLASGDGVCVLTNAPLDDSDPFGITDAWLVPGAVGTL